MPPNIWDKRVTRMEVQRGKQQRPKRQPVEVEIAACPVRLSYATNVRRKGQGRMLTKTLWLVKATILGTTQAPWWILTDWPVEEERSTMRIFTMYRERWAAEDSFKVTQLPRLGPPQNRVKSILASLARINFSGEEMVFFYFSKV